MRAMYDTSRKLPICGSRREWHKELAAAGVQREGQRATGAKGRVGRVTAATGNRLARLRRGVQDLLARAQRRWPSCGYALDCLQGSGW